MLSEKKGLADWPYQAEVRKDAWKWIAGATKEREKEEINR